MKTKMALAAAMMAALVVIAFQNCSGLSQPSGVSNMSSNKGPEENPNDIQILSSPASMSLYTGQAMNLSVIAESQGGHALSYQWFKDSVEITGAIYPDFQIASFAAANAGQYSVKISNAVDADTLYATVSLSANPVITITTQPQPITLAQGQVGQLTVVASITPSQTLAYQWFKDGASYPGGTSATLALPADGPGRAGNYYVRVSSTVGPLQSVNSSTVKVTATQTFSVNSSTGCVNGFCACVTPGQLYVPYRPSAAAICVVKGYADVTTFTTAGGSRGQNHCSADGLSCFVNQNPGNIVCDQVSCTK